MKKITIIQDIPTIHNNSIIKKINTKYKVEEYYASLHDKDRYDYKQPINTPSAKEYGLKLNPLFIMRIFQSKDLIILVGIMNINTKFLLALLSLFQKKFIYWTDMPSDISQKGFLKKFKRFITLRALKLSNSDIWCVGGGVVNFFLVNKFQQKRLINMPILVDVIDDIDDEKFHKSKLSFFTGSRLIYEKGFDILINAIGELDSSLLEKFHLNIAGDGPLFNEYQQLISDKGLEKVIKLLGWCEENDFKKYLRESAVVIQPSRFDAYGLAIYGMANKCLVIGTNTSGAVADRVTNEKNGFIYKYSDTKYLKNLITNILSGKISVKNLASNAHKEAKKWQIDYVLNVLERYDQNQEK